MGYFTNFISSIFVVKETKQSDIPFVGWGSIGVGIDNALNLTEFSSDKAILAVAEARSLKRPSVLINVSHFLFLKVVGEVTVAIAGNDTNGSTAISATYRVKGVEKWPGYLILHGMNHSAVTITGVLASTVESYWAQYLEPNDALLA
jgi:hypothetical protein